jgi:alpha-glucosidase
MTAPQWWQDAVCYQVYPRSFADANGDGIGDLPGLIQKLDYLKWLGVDALWISPFYPSAQVDWGYDISDYNGVDPDYGTLADADRLIEEAHRRDMHILLDLVLNHTSDRHPWFQQSKSGRSNPYRDWYIWRDGRNGGSPNDWESTFGGPAWTLDEATGQYYYHYFFKEQPDLNWRNPEVKQAMFDVARFWLERGVDGFRLDAIGTIFEAEDLPDNQTPGSLEDIFISFRKGIIVGWELWKEKNRFQTDQPEIHPLLQEMRKLVDTYPGRILLGESDNINLYGSGENELHSVFNFELMYKLEADYLRNKLADRLPCLPPGAWECNTVGNHDRIRSYTFYSDGQQDELRARLALALVALLPGTPVYYNGEEIGIRNLPPARLADLKDTLAIHFYQILRDKHGMSHAEAFDIAANFMGRDGCRTPMQWRNAPNAGFSPPGVATWLPVNPDYSTGVNVESQQADPGSMLSFIRRLLQLRKDYTVLRRGDIQLIEDTGQVLAFLRSYKGQRYLVALNISAEAHAFLPEDSARLKPVYMSQHEVDGQERGIIQLAAYEICIAESLETQ